MLKRLSFVISIMIAFACNVNASGTINIGGQPRLCDTLEIYKIGPGVIYQHLYFPEIPLYAYLAIVDLNDQNLAIESFIGQDKVLGTEQTSSACKRNTSADHDVFLGINGSFSEVSVTDPDFIGYPIGGNIDNGVVRTHCGRYITSNEWLASIGIDKNKVPYIDRMQTKGIVKCNKTIQEANFVQTNKRRRDNELSFYNEFAGAKTFSNDNGTEVYFKPVDGQWSTNKPMRCIVEQIVKDKGGNPTVKGQGILSGSGEYKAFLEQLSVGDEIEITVQISMDIAQYNNIYPEFKTLLSGNRCIMRDGVVTWDATADPSCSAADPRTVTGYSADQTTFYALVVDGRQIQSRGLSATDACAVLYHFGARWAINNDSGGSSTFVINRNVVNSPSDGSERAVGDGFMFVNIAPDDDNIAKLSTDKPKIVLPKYAKYKPGILTYNKYDKLLKKDFDGATLSCPASLGHTTKDGYYIASDGENGQITATYGNIITTIDVELVSAPFKMRLDSVTVDNRKNYEIEVESEIQNKVYQISPSVLTWSIADPTVCSIVDGIIIPLSDGRTTIEGELGEFKESMIVNIQMPQSSRIIQEDFAEISNWKVTASGGPSKGVFNTLNRPEDWEHGSVYNYTISGTVRAPSIKMTPIVSRPFYGIPDTIRVTINSGKAVITKATVGLRTNNNTQLNATVENIESEKECTLIIPLDKVISNPDDRINYPLRLGSITFQIDTKSLTAGQYYALAIKDIVLAYEGIEVGGVDNPLVSKLIIYPNPVSSRGNLYIRLNEPCNLSVEIYSMQGQVVAHRDFGYQQADEISISQVSKLLPGTYILKAKIDNDFQTAKIIIK